MPDNRFHNGLTETQEGALDDILIDIASIIARIENFPPHRSIALGVTKLEEAKMWLADRKRKAPSGAPR